MRCRSVHRIGLRCDLEQGHAGNHSNLGSGPNAIKAITLWQPWASLVISGVKQYETRSWSTRHRGPLAIHAAAQPVGGKLDPAVSALCLHRLGVLAKDLPLGAVLGVVDVVDVRKTHDWIQLAANDNGDRYVVDHWDKIAGDWRPGRFAWKLDNARRFEEPIRFKGAQGLWSWDPPPEILRYI